MKDACEMLKIHVYILITRILRKTLSCTIIGSTPTLRPNVLNANLQFQYSKEKDAGGVTIW